jgi:hypothetical protein
MMLFQPLTHRHSYKISLLFDSNSMCKTYRRKNRTNLKECPLLEMTQFSCNPPQNGVPEPGVVVCEPVVVSAACFCFASSASLIGSHDVVSTVNPPAQLQDQLALGGVGYTGIQLLAGFKNKGCI